MFSVAFSELTERLRNAKVIQEQVSSQELNASKSFENKVLKGLFFVALYGAIENSLSKSVTICIETLNNLQLDLLKIKPVIWAIVFDPECKRMEQGGERKWSNRNKLFVEIKNTKAKAMDPLLFPASTGNIKKKQVDSIWETFDLQSPAFPDPKIIGLLDTIAENRMAIAHGRRTASDVGASYSAKDLLDFYDSINKWSNYIISCFESFIKNQEYKV